MVAARHVGLRAKLLVAFLVVTSFVGVAGVVGYQGIHSTQERATYIYTDEMPIATASIEMRLAVESERAALHAYLLGETEAAGEFDAASANFQQSHDAIAQNEDLTPKERELITNIGQQHDRSVDLAKAAMSAHDKGQDGTVSQDMEAYDRVQSNLLPATASFESMATDNMDAAIAQARATERRSSLLIVGLTGLAVLVALGLGIVLSGRITDPVVALRDASEALAEGQVDADIEVDAADDEVGDMVAAFEDMQAYLQTVAAQAEALADQRFDAAVLDEDVPGTFGATISRMRHDVETAQRDVEAAKADVESMNAALEATADDYGETMQLAAGGDLTQRMDATSESRAMERIGDAFNEMMAEFEATIAHLQAFGQTVAASSETVTSTTSEIQSASEQVSTSVQEIADGAVQQDQHLQEVSGEMSTLSGTIEEVAASADQVATTADGAVERGKTGREYAEVALTEMDDIESQARATIDEVEALEREVDEIGEIVDMISEIAAQTNLLALNANIEAARAGEAGSGFAVVADEVKGLAEEAAAATQDIETRIAAVQATTVDAVGDMQTLGDSVESGSETIEEALAALDTIVVHVEEANDGIQEISAAADEQAASTEEVVSMIDEVATLSRDTAAETETVSAAAEEQTASLSDVGANVESLAEGADELESLMASFAVSESVGATTATGEELAADGEGASGNADPPADVEGMGPFEPAAVPQDR